MTKSIKVNKDTTSSIASGITGAPSGAEAFSRAKSVDNFQKARTRAFCYSLVGAKFIQLPAYSQSLCPVTGAHPHQIYCLLQKGSS